MTSSDLGFKPPAGLVATMTEQYGVFTSSQAYGFGFTHAELQHLRDRRDLTSVRRGVYAVREDYHALEDFELHRVDAQAALLCLDKPTTLSHETAAVWSGLPLLRPDLRLVHATRPELKASRTEAGIHHHPGALPDGHWRELGGVRLTTDARTAVDVARTNDYARGLAVVDSAIRNGTPLADIRDVQLHCRAWPGARGASRAVAEGDGRAANPGESFSRAILTQAGVAPTDIQVAIFDGRGLVGYADFGWLPLMVLGEFDGRLKYGAGAQGADVLWNEKLREDRLRSLGYEVIRWTWADLLDPTRLIARVSAALARVVARGAIVA